MYLTRIKLKNFRGIKDLELSFVKNKQNNRQWTLLLGENGTGKSNVLKAIGLVLAGSNALGELLGDSDSWIHRGADSCSIEAEVLDVQAKNKTRHLTINIHRGDSLAKIMENNQATLAIIDETKDSAQKDYLVIGYGASRRLNQETFNSNKKGRHNKRASLLGNLFDSNFSLNSLASWIIELDYRFGPQGLLLVSEALENMLPEATLHSIDKEKQQVLFSTPEGLIPLEQLSEGVQNMAAWIGDLLYKITQTYSEKETRLSTRGVLLIDEIDLHLHPRWQRQLYDFISAKLPHFQIIASTHSPITVQQADEGELYTLHRNDDQQIELVPFVGSPQNLLVNQLLMSPAFGVESDESLAIEKIKQAYDELSTEKSRSLFGEENAEDSPEAKALLERLPRRTNSILSAQETNLLERIEAALTSK